MVNTSTVTVFIPPSVSLLDMLTCLHSTGQRPRSLLTLKKADSAEVVVFVRGEVTDVQSRRKHDEVSSGHSF